MSNQTRPLPLRVAIIGLSASAVTSWAATAHLPYLLSDQGCKYYTIVALCNSSEDAARRAVQHYNLPPTTKAYGSPDDLAKDENIDLVICNTRVDKHIETILPSISAGKDIYVEWPVAPNVEDVNKISQAAEKHNVKLAVGLQGRWAPPVMKLKEVLEKGNVGRVLSSEVHVYGGSAAGRDTLSSGWEYFADKRIGGNHVTILFGHLIDQVQYLLGPLSKSSTTAHSHIQWPKIRVIDQNKKEVVNEIPTDVPDLLYLTGTFENSSFVIPPASLSASYHRAWPLPGEATTTWTIVCEHADVRLRVFDYPSLQADAYGKPVLIDVHRADTGEVKSISWRWSEEFEELPVRSRNTAHCLQAFARGHDGDWADLKGAVKLTEQLESWLEGQNW